MGSVSAELLARAGIGKITLIDRDVVELSNLQRQNLFNEGDIGKPKAMAAKEHLGRINSEIEIGLFADDLNFGNIDEILNAKISLILDCTDNMEARFLINDFAVKNNAPFIYSSAVGTKGYVFNVLPGSGPCIRCFLKEAPQLDTCETVGVLNTITSIIPALQANEAMKILLNKSHEKSLLFFDVWKNELLKIKVEKNKACIACARRNFEYLDGKKSSRVIKLCGHNIYQIKTDPMDGGQFNELKNRLKRIGKVADFEYCINFDGKITIFNDGRALIKAKTENEAKSLHSRLVGS